MPTTMADVAATDTAAVQHLCSRWARAWNDHDGDAVAALCSDDLVYDEPALDGTVHGREPIRRFVMDMEEMFPDYRFALEGLYAEVSRRAVLVAWSMSGTVPGTDHRVQFHGDDRLELGADGLITSYRCLYDLMDVRAQIRAASEPA